MFDFDISFAERLEQLRKEQRRQSSQNNGLEPLYLELPVEEEPPRETEPNEDS